MSLRTRVSGRSEKREIEWQSSTLVKGDLVEAVSELKAQPGKDVLVTGSVTLVSLRAGATRSP